MGIFGKIFGSSNNRPQDDAFSAFNKGGMEAVKENTAAHMAAAACHGIGFGFDAGAFGFGIIEKGARAGRAGCESASGFFHDKGDSLLGKQTGGRKAGAKKNGKKADFTFKDVAKMNSDLKDEVKELAGKYEEIVLTGKDTNGILTFLADGKDSVIVNLVGGEIVVVKAGSKSGKASSASKGEQKASSSKKGAKTDNKASSKKQEAKGGEGASGKVRSEAVVYSDDEASNAAIEKVVAENPHLSEVFQQLKAKFTDSPLFFVDEAKTVVNLTAIQTDGLNTSEASIKVYKKSGKVKIA